MEYKTSKELMKAIKAQMLLDDIQMKDLAIKMNVSQQTLSSKFNRNNASFNEFKNICDALGYTLDITISKKDDTP